MNEEPHFRVPDTFANDTFLGHFDGCDCFHDRGADGRGEYVWFRFGDGDGEFSGFSARSLREMPLKELLEYQDRFSQETLTFIKSYVTLLQ